MSQDWKIVLVTSLFKKGQGSNQTNSYFTYLCLQQDLMKHLSSHHMLSDAQFGFCENCSAELQLIDTILMEVFNYTQHIGCYITLTPLGVFLCTIRVLLSKSVETHNQKRCLVVRLLLIQNANHYKQGINKSM